MGGKPQALEHEPRRPLSDFDVAGDFVTANTVLAIQEHPERDEPFVQREGAVFKDGPDFNGELLLAALTLPYASSLEIEMLLALAVRARRPIGPSHRSHKPNANVWISKESDRLNQCGRNLQNIIHALIILGVAMVNQVIFCPYKEIDNFLWKYGERRQRSDNA